MEQDKSTKPEYGSLGEADKMRAILGAVMEPVSKQLALDLSGVQYDQLDTDAKAKVDAIFSEEGVEISESDGTKKYRLGDEKREKLGRNIDMKSVHGAIADKMMGDLGLDL